eukprot:TRINITY_DN7105_c0_g1_i1.p1 TRINITY_DN7105_c0_g1~~TRINITY_DN7105_c0_g1_i1.p1  ORF type:complete len:497 (+),score=115.99 TRINITY_DN7105_c0_g1_i1:138-1628(+)
MASQKGSSSNSGVLEVLPSETLMYLLYFVSPRDLLALSATNRRMRVAALDLRLPQLKLLPLFRAWAPLWDIMRPMPLMERAKVCRLRERGWRPHELTPPPPAPSKASIKRSSSRTSPSPPPHNPDRIYHIVVLGRQGIGKSAFLRQFMSGTYDDKNPLLQAPTPDYTRHMHKFVLKKDSRHVTVEFMDSAGTDEWNKDKHTFGGMDEYGYIFAYDQCWLSSYVAIKSHYAGVVSALKKRHASKESVGMVLVANKGDRTDNIKVKPNRGQQRAKKWQMPFFTVSAKTGKNVAASVYALIEQMDQKRAKNVARQHGEVTALQSKRGTIFEGTTRKNLPHRFGLVIYSEEENRLFSHFFGEFCKGRKHGVGVLIPRQSLPAHLYVKGDPTRLISGVWSSGTLQRLHDYEYLVDPQHNSTNTDTNNCSNNTQHSNDSNSTLNAPNSNATPQHTKNDEELLALLKAPSVTLTTPSVSAQPGNNSGPKRASDIRVNPRKFQM